MPARLVLVCGLPGAGKTTTALQLVAERGRGAASRPTSGCRTWPSTSSTSRPGAASRRSSGRSPRSCSRAGLDVVIEWGLWTRAERDVLRERARALGAAVELRFLDEPFDVLWERVRERGREQEWGSRAIERDELAEWADAFEAPDADGARALRPARAMSSVPTPSRREDPCTLPR